MKCTTSCDLSHADPDERTGPGGEEGGDAAVGAAALPRLRPQGRGLGRWTIRGLGQRRREVRRLLHLPICDNQTKQNSNAT
eukprot:5917744-Prymnesium_polylepis.1